MYVCIVWDDDDDDSVIQVEEKSTTVTIGDKFVLKYQVDIPLCSMTSDLAISDEQKV